VDLSALSKIDAAGVGELIRAFNMTVAVNGGLRVVNTTAWVREILERAQLFKLLAGEDAARQQFA
jgi:anti-anti-sigma regulatory factor